MDVRFGLRAGTIGRGAHMSSRRSGSDHNALSGARKENSCFSVDKDLHGWRSHVHCSSGTCVGNGGDSAELPVD